MKKLLCDSSSDIFSFNDVDFSSVPLKVRVGEKEYVDTGKVDIEAMNLELSQTKEKTGTSCPNAQEWIDAFTKDDDNICITISSNLSGSYNSCLQAKQIFEEDNKHKVLIIDSKCAGSELRLLAEYIATLIKENKTLEEIEKLAYEYSDHLHTYFLTSSVKNLVNAGRIPSFVGKAISVLKISMVGVGSDEGKIKIVHETRNSKKALDFIFEKMEERGYTGGKVYMSSCQNTNGVEYITSRIKEKYPDSDIQVFNTGVLCSYYVEANGIILAFEGDDKDLVL